MNIEEARKAAHAHPPKAERRSMLEDHIGALRRDFFAHLMNLERIQAFESANGPLPSEEEAIQLHQAVAQEHGGMTTHPRVVASSDLLDMVRGKAAAEKALDTINLTLERTLEKLAELDRNPDLE